MDRLNEILHELGISKVKLSKLLKVINILFSLLNTPIIIAYYEHL